MVAYARSSTSEIKSSVSDVDIKARQFHIFMFAAMLTSTKEAFHRVR